MKTLLPLLISCTLALSSFAQILKEDDLEVLLLNASYEDVIKHVNRYNIAKSPNIENKKAEALIRSGKLQEAQLLLDSIMTKVKAQSGVALAVTETNQGLLHLIAGRNDLGMESLQSAISKLDNNHLLEYSKALTYLGLVYFNTGRIAQAEEQMQAALGARETYVEKMGNRLPKAFEELLAASYNDLGLVYSNIDKDQALDYYEKALALYEKLHGKSHPKIAISITNTAFMYRDLELYGDAINNFETAKNIWDKVYPEAHATKAFVLFNLGETYTKMGNAKTARAYYEQALTMYAKSYGGKHPDLGRVENALGNLELSANRFDAGLSHYQRALQANVSDFESTDISVNPQLQNFYEGYVLLYSLLYKAQAFENRYFSKSLKLKDLELALQTLQTCDTLIDKLRQQISNERDKLLLGTIANEVYADGVRIAWETADVAFKKKGFYQMAFYFAEKSKSAVLLDAIADTQAKSYAGIPTELLEEEKMLKSAITLCHQKLAQKPSADEEKYLRETAFNLNRSYQAFVKRMEEQFPQYYNLKFNSTSPTLAQIRQKLGPATLLLSYFVEEKNNTLYIFQISQKHYQVSQIKLPDDFDKYITGLRNSLFYNEVQTYVKTSNKLSKLLIPKKINSNLNDLVILPSGRLSIIPFETLFEKPVNQPLDYAHLPYLVNRFNIRYEFSTGLILQKSQTEENASLSIFLCAPVTFTRAGLIGLPATESEVRDISGLFASKNLKSTFYTHQQADKKLIQSEDLKEYSFLHFATHGLVDEVNPELSRIYLQSASDSDDGNLFAGEIYNLQLNANLVTLSACQTGLGKISKGEGVIGLSRALVYAGARNCIVSFWNVADESTAQLMKEFYHLILEHPSHAISANLAQAKKNLRKNNSYSAPYYWAPFILIGY